MDGHELDLDGALEALTPGDALDEVFGADGLGLLPPSAGGDRRLRQSAGRSAGISPIMQAIGDDPRFGPETNLPPEACTPENLALAKCIAFFILEGLKRNATSTVRLDPSCQPPHKKQFFDFGITSTKVSIAAGAAETVICSGRLNSNWFGYLTAMGWAAEYSAENPQVTDSAYENLDVTLRINGHRNPQYTGISRNLGSIGFNLEIPGVAAQRDGTDAGRFRGSLVELVAINQHATETIEVLGRLRGYQFPLQGVGGQGSAGTLSPEG